MKKLKRILGTLIFALGFAVLGQAQTVYAEQIEKNGFVFESYEDERAESKGTVCLVGYTGSEKNLVIPENVQGKTVYAVEPQVFSGNKTIESVKLPDTVKVIGMYAFANCSNLKEVHLGSLQYAYEWHGLAGILSGCGNLERLTMSDTADFDLTADSPNYEFDMFNRAVRDHLKYIYIGSNMKSVSEELFYGTSLETVEVGKGNPLYSSYGGVVYSADGKELIVCGTSYPNTVYEIPEGVTTLGPIGFSECRNIKTLVIPETVKKIQSEDLWGLKAAIKTKKHSYADNYAKQKGIKVEYNGTAKPEHTVHVWDSKYTTDVKATCAMEGKQSIHCLMCGAVKPGSQRKIARVPHTYRTTVVKATMSKNGNIANTCTGCKRTINQTIARPKSVSLSTTTYTYNGKTKKPAVKVKTSAGKTLGSGDYKVSYSSGRKNVGQYKVKVTFRGNYSGSITKTFKIIPKKTSISSVKAGRKKMTVKWKRQSKQVTGYQIQYSVDKKFKKGVKTSTIKKYKTTSKSISRLKTKKKYYVRVRTYKTAKINGKSTKLYSGWSKAKAVRIK